MVVDNVERKESRVESVPGVVVVTLASKEDKLNILRVKAIKLEITVIRVCSFIQICQNVKDS